MFPRGCMCVCGCVCTHLCACRIFPDETQSHSVTQDQNYVHKRFLQHTVYYKRILNGKLRSKHDPWAWGQVWCEHEERPRLLPCNLTYSGLGVRTGTSRGGCYSTYHTKNVRGQIFAFVIWVLTECVWGAVSLLLCPVGLCHISGELHPFRLGVSSDFFLAYLWWYLWSMWNFS